MTTASLVMMGVALFLVVTAAATGNMLAFFVAALCIGLLFAWSEKK